MNRSVPALPSDPGLPGARGLFGPQGVAAVSGFLADRGLEAADVRPVQAIYNPSRSLLVRYRVAARGHAGPRSLTVCAEVRRRPRSVRPVPDGFADRYGIADPVERRGNMIVWAFPYDTALAGMEEAASGGAVRDALGTTGERPVAVSVEPLRYRPRRRAVFRYRTLRHGRRGRTWETSFGKVLPGDKARRIEWAAPGLNVAARRIPLALPAGRLGEDGFVFPALAGRSLRDLLVRGGSLPAPSRVAGLPLSLAAAMDDAGVDGLAERPGPAELAASGANLVSHLVPGFSDAAGRIREAAVTAAERDPGRPGVVHGDLYEAQIFVGDGYRLGLIDLDDLGRGDAVLDAANFCAHLLALALAVPSSANRLMAYRRLVRPAFARALDVPLSALAWREAVCMLLLAAGPFRVLDPAWPAEVGRRVAMAVRLLEDP
jgi:hypothetical protein